MFVIWSGNHKFYIQFLRLLGLQSFIITRYILKWVNYYYTGCLKIREFRIQSVVGKDSVELEKYLKKKFPDPEEDISTLILFNT
jgi:hypothetical protein